MTGQLTNHLFQSTLFALATALLVLAFRNNRARVRYALWLAASLKFLIPFSMLIALGSQIRWMPAVHEVAARAASPDVVQTVEQFSEPFTVAIPAQSRQETGRRLLAIAAIWFCGLAWIMILRLRAWRGMRIAIRRSQPIDLGLPIEARLSSGIFEPGIVGLWRPMLLLPQGILERLTPSELEAVIAHELCHIRRRDNLFAAIHMLIEALFWFHPLVWWIGARLLDERERACDEYVVSQGNQPDIYANAILNVCKLYTESPLACVSGVTGADIRRRLEAIMSDRGFEGLSRAKKFLLAGAGLAALTGPLSIGLLIGLGNPPAARAQRPEPLSALEFEAATIKPSPRNNLQTTRFGVSGGPGTSDPAVMTWSSTSLASVIATAYEVPIDRLINAAAIPRPPFDIVTKVPAEATKQQIPGMLRKLLEDRFHLVIHSETRDSAVYVMTVARGGSKLKLAEANVPPDDLRTMGALQVTRDMFPFPQPGQGTTLSMNGNTRFAARSVSTATLADLLSRDAGRPIIDKTRLTGIYDVRLAFVPQSRGENAPPPPAAPPPPGGSATPALTHELNTTPTLFSAVAQLGLKLDSGKALIRFIVIEHIDSTPTPN